MIIKYNKIDNEFVEKNYPLLSEAVNRIKGLTDIQKEYINGLCIEIALKSNGSTDIFEDEFLGEFDEDFNDY